MADCDLTVVGDVFHASAHAHATEVPGRQAGRIEYRAEEGSCRLGSRRPRLPAPRSSRIASALHGHLREPVPVEIKAPGITGAGA
jgi:hypothetical protein